MKYESLNIFDFGHSNLRLGNYNIKFPNNKNISEKKITNLTNLGSTDEDFENTIFQLIKEVENKSSNYIDRVNVMIDPADLLLIDFSIKKNFEGKKIDKNDLNFLINEAKIAINKSYKDRKIIHTVIQKHYNNNYLYEEFPPD